MRLSPLFSDGVVLQRDADVKIWGEARPGEKIVVVCGEATGETVADGEGRWEVALGALRAGGPYEMTVLAGDEKRTIRDVLVGDVWVLGGQSNMELPVRRTLDLFAEEVRNVHLPQVRQFAVPLVYDFHGPRRDVDGGRWIAATGGDVLDFSAAGFFFAKELWERFGVPVGLILTAVGGTPVEAWMSEPTLRRLGGYEALLDRCKDDVYVSETRRKDEERTQCWHRELNERDSGLREGWFRTEWVEAGWETFEVPGSWRGTHLESFRGAVWFRKTIEVPPVMAEGEALLKLGTIVDADETYVNGTLVGTTGYRYPPRRYRIPPGVLKPGVNTIAIRVVSTHNPLEFVEDMPYELVSGGLKLDLKGTWRYRTGAEAAELKPPTFFQYMPAGVYNGMIEPLRRYAVKGVLWYQGESNTHQPERYGALFREMVRDWRRLWGRDDLPWIYVQLANYAVDDGGRHGWARLRDEQRRCLDIPGTAMATAVDIGEANDLHPQDKKTLGHRLALCARKIVYGEDVVHSGPLFARMEREGRAIRLFFDHVGGGLVARGGEPLSGFEVCGPDGVFRPARAAIEEDGRTVTVWCDEVLEPVHVRYAWANNPEGANLYNREGLPASPFTTEGGEENRHD
ncbi:MAG: sialate O-acetylesterase [Candidatus Reconcilbacillus cellulovorans]|uniref:Sialate O-acetylesterase n=1 Tax=Candidatus Reconcilbacillus cellulovorans TaxID=1906605 RepID=A0A2A6E1B3_9BACL|nr:MAG: sialate O-acetylesterase [Candidatus Reconcilbacillus cellulovorans]